MSKYYKWLTKSSLLIIGILFLPFAAVSKTLDADKMNWNALKLHRCHTSYLVNAVSLKHIELDKQLHANRKFQDSKSVKFFQDLDTFGEYNVANNELKVFKSCVQHVLDGGEEKMIKMLERQGKPQYTTQFEVDTLYCYFQYFDETDAIQWLHNGAKPEQLSTALTDMSKNQDDVINYLKELERGIKKKGVFETYLDTYKKYESCVDKVNAKYYDNSELLAERARGY